jgi:glycosyltransferase involved in cell wall biosynthesis
VPTSTGGHESSGGPRPAPILYVHHRSELGGSPSSLSHLIEQLDRDRFEPHVFCPPGAAAGAFAESGAIVHTGPVAGLTHIWASTYRGRRWVLLVRELLLLPRHLISFRRTLRSNDFALVHLNDSPMIPAARLARRSRTPVVWHLRSALPAAEGPRRTRFVRRAIERYASASIAINDDVRDSFDVGSETIPNPVDLERFHPGHKPLAKQELGLDPERLVISFYGFLYPLKGFHDFIRAAALLRARGVEATYLIVGGAVRGSAFFETTFGWMLRQLGLATDYETEARELVSALGLEQEVVFVPFTRNAETHYIASDVVVSPSRGPELGRPVLEGAACGCAVVASGSLSGAGIVVPEHTGELVPRRSPDALAAALHKLATDAGLRMRLGEHGRRHAEAEFDAALSTRRVMAVYDRVLGAP